MNKVIKQKDHVVGVVLDSNNEQIGVYCYLGKFDEIRCYSMSTFVSMLMNDAVLQNDKDCDSRFFNVPIYQANKEGRFNDYSIKTVISKLLISTTEEHRDFSIEKGLFSSKLFFSYRDIMGLDLGEEAAKYNPDGFSVNTYTKDGNLHSASKLLTIIGGVFEDDHTIQSYKIVTENLEIKTVTKADLLNYLNNGYFIVNDRNFRSKQQTEDSWFDYIGAAPEVKSKELSEEYHKVTVADLFNADLKPLNNILIEFVWFDRNIVYYDVFNHMMLLTESKNPLALKNGSNTVIKRFDNTYLNESITENLTISSSLYQTMKNLKDIKDIGKASMYVCYRYQGEPVAMISTDFNDGRKEATFSDVRTRFGFDIYMFNKCDISKQRSEELVDKLNSKGCYITSISRANEQMRFKVKDMLNKAENTNDYPFVVVDL